MQTPARRMASASAYSHLQPPNPCYKESDLIPVDPSKPLWKHQVSLPMLPVPTLQETADRYLASIRPLVTPAEFSKTKAAVEDFIKPGGVGEELQKRLLAKKAQTDAKNRSWLIDWWNDYAYMAYRDPIVVNVSYFYVFKDDKKRMEQCARAASLIQGAMDFRTQLLNGTLEPEFARTTPLCMQMFRYMFNHCRIPVIPSDVTRSAPQSNTHVVVIRKNKFYSFDTYHQGQPLSTAEIEAQLRAIVKMAGPTPAEPVGLLTSENRDTWARARETLIKDPVNAKSLDVIERALFVVCLDDTKPVTKVEASRACWHGDGKNRFFDKSMQFIVFENGKAGFNGEHSMMDATPTSRLCDYVCDALAKEKVNHGTSLRSLPAPSNLPFNILPEVSKTIKAAEKNFNELTGKHDVDICAFEGYGKNLIKKMGISPDAFAQMVIQLAYYKMHGKVCATYESAMTRKFAYGRTETCRSCSVDSAAWVRAMEDANVPWNVKGELGRKALASHVKYMNACTEGKGVDRHWLGLKLTLKEGEPKHAMFTDPVFARSSHWNLSTSQITSEYYDGYGWGEVVADGYGIAYMVKEESLAFNIACLKNMHASHMRHYLGEAARDMKKAFEACPPPPKAKL